MPRERKYRYEINPRSVKLGGGLQLRLIEDDAEVGGGEFPADPSDKGGTDDAYADALRTGEEWLASR